MANAAGWKQLCHATGMSQDSESGTKGEVESKWSPAFGHGQLNVIENNAPPRHERTTVMAWSESGRGQLGLDERGICR